MTHKSEDYKISAVKYYLKETGDLEIIGTYDCNGRCIE